MADSKNTLTPEEEQKALTENPVVEQSTGVEAKLDDELSATTTMVSEVKVRHDTVK